MGLTIPVCLFNGFLESGKTTLIQSMLQDPSVNNGNGILILLCEEGEVELEPDRFCSSAVHIEIIEDSSFFTEEHLRELQEQTSCRMVMIEKHVLWPEFFIRSRLPENWTIIREYMTIDASQIISQNKNFRELVGDSIHSSNYFLVNRMPDDQELQARIHKIIRALNRNGQIVFQSEGGRYYIDDMAVPLPYDTDQDFIVIADDQYAWFQQDMMADPARYEGKTVSLKGRAFEQETHSFPGLFYFGRFVHSYSMKDVHFMPVPAVYKGELELNDRDWYSITAHITLEKIVASSDMAFPVLNIDSVELLPDGEKPVPEVAMVYDGNE